MTEENKVQAKEDILQETPPAPAQTAPAAIPHMKGPWINRRFILYDKIKLSVLAMDIIIGVCAVLLILAFVLGTIKGN